MASPQVADGGDGLYIWRVAASMFHHRIQNGSGPHPVSNPMGTRGLSLGVKRPRCEADHLPPSSAEVKNAWTYDSTPPICLHGVVLSLKKSTYTTLPFTF